MPKAEKYLIVPLKDGVIDPETREPLPQEGKPDYHTPYWYAKAKEGEVEVRAIRPAAGSAGGPSWRDEALAEMKDAQKNKPEPKPEPKPAPKAKDKAKPKKASNGGRPPARPVK